MHLSEQTRIGISRLMVDIEKMGITIGNHAEVALSFKSIGFVEKWSAKSRALHSSSIHRDTPQKPEARGKLVRLADSTFLDVK